MKETIIKIIYTILDLLPEKIAEKIKITGCVWLGDWHLLPPRFPAIPANDFVEASDERIGEIFRGFPKEEIDLAKKYVQRIKKLGDLPYPKDALLYKHDRIYGENAGEFRKMNEGIRNQAKKWKCHHRRWFVPTSECFYFHHGLRFSRTAVKEYVKGKVFIDAGAGFGDSALIFLTNYHPLKVISFEPSAVNREHYLTLMRANGIPDEKYELISAGLGEKAGILHFEDDGTPGVSLLKQEKSNFPSVTVQTLDHIFLSRPEKIGMIKADVEGMCAALVKGAEKIIRRDLPVLCLSIYHNQEELFGVYPILRAFGLDYEFHLQCHSSKAESIELVLMGYPKHLQ